MEVARTTRLATVLVASLVSSPAFVSAEAMVPDTSPAQAQQTQGAPPPPAQPAPAQAPPPPVYSVVPPPAAGRGLEGSRSFTFSLGTGLALGGNVIMEGVGAIEGRPAVFVEQAYTNHFSDGMRLRFGGGWGLSYNLEAFGFFGYGKLNATERIVGSVAGYPLYTRFSNGRAIDLEGGLRYYVRPEGRARSYVAVSTALRFLDDTTATIRVPELGLTISDFDYWNGSTVLTFGGDGGLSYGLSERFSIGAEVGLRFQAGPDPAQILFGTTLADINDTGSRWSLPISGFMTYRFR